MSESSRRRSGDSEAVRLVDRSGRQLRILIVEDDATAALDYSLMIEDAGGKAVGTACSACTAEALTKALSPDAILMDVRLLGDRDGIDAATAIRTFSQAPVIFVTAYSEPATRKRIRTFNGTEPVVKPAEPHALISAMAAVTRLAILCCLSLL
jgi:CheY-like chemotaxis protein